MTSLYCGRTVRSNHRRFSIKNLFLKSLQYPQETPVLWSLFKKVAALKACNFIKKGPQNMCFPVNIAKFLILLISKIICELLHRPKGSMSKLYDGVRLQGLTHRSSLSYLNRHEPSPFPRHAFGNLRRIPLMNQLKADSRLGWRNNFKMF